ncbi:6-pyruvoyl trahydropterin synthase family protein [Gynuella sp.]|uniref:6-pyruvoyl trahydropterin synthase family protein n=1 Tax=Gynuella sp. TaxID=2969146 RepID=UPI003D0CD2FA
MASLFVEELTVMDFSYLHALRGIVGESWIVDIILEGELNNEGMVFDFGLVKKEIKHAIDEGMDHKFLIPASIAGLQIVEDDEDFRFCFENVTGMKLCYRSPREAVYLLEADRINTETVTPILEKHLKTIVPANVSNVKVKLRAQEIEGAYYHYSHGLKKHQGDCQRICHGHRSPIKIFIDGKRSGEEEFIIAKQWQDIYLVTREDVLHQDGIYITLGYEAEQGYFELTLPKASCDFMSGDSTVELIAVHLAEHIKERHPNKKVEVQAYEGYKKGAFANA